MNRRLLEATGGGLFGVRDPHRLAYLVEIVQDDQVFPTIWDKAAMYLQRLAISQGIHRREQENSVDIHAGLSESERLSLERTLAGQS